MYFAGMLITILIALPTIYKYVTDEELQKSNVSKLFLWYGITLLLTTVLPAPIMYDYIFPFMSYVQIGKYA